jgi:hypothetical protein
LCHATCVSDSDCQSGCCAVVQGKPYGVCSPVSYCGGGVCAGPGSTCVSDTDCCQSGPGISSSWGASCGPDQQCHAICTGNSACASNCCVELKAGGPFVCADHC